jgi:hypothetical protein
MTRGPTLPGDPRAVHRLGRCTGDTVTYRDVDDQVVTLDRSTIRRQILDTLAGAPHAKVALRERLHLPEDVVYRELKVLRAAGQVKAVGRRMGHRQWALASWQPPTAEQHVEFAQQNLALPQLTVATPPLSRKREPAKESWWTRPDLTRAEFQERARRRGPVSQSPQGGEAHAGGGVMKTD